MAQEIRSVMTTDPIAVDGNAALVDAARAMRDHDVVTCWSPRTVKWRES